MSKNMIMDDKPKVFGYRGSYRTYLAALAGIGFLALLEIGTLVLLVFYGIKNPTTQVVVGTILLSISLGVPAFVLSWPLRTRHRLWDTYFRLHYGKLKLDIPRDRITSARSVCQKINGFDTLTSRFEENNHRLKACFSMKGQILLILDPPVETTQFANIKEVLFNADDSPTLLKELQKTSKEGVKQANLKEEKTVKVEFKLEKPKIFISSGLPGEENGEFLIRTKNLSRSFGDDQVVKDLDLAIKTGEIYGFLGCNGAGKTTTIKMLVGLLEPSKGSVEISGKDLWKNPELAKQTFGYVPDRPLLYHRLTGREYLEFIAQVRGIPGQESRKRIDHWLGLLDLSEKASRLCSKYSFGMKQKLSLAAALLHQPALLILDEPLNGLDPRSARRLKDIFVEFSQNNMSIFMSTHDLATAESVCSRVGILHQGQIIAEGSADQLQEMSSGENLEAVFLQLTEEDSEVADQR